MLVGLNGSVAGLRAQGRGQEEAWRRSTETVEQQGAVSCQRLEQPQKAGQRPACIKAVTCVYHLLDGDE